MTSTTRRRLAAAVAAGSLLLAGCTEADPAESTASAEAAERGHDAETDIDDDAPEPDVEDTEAAEPVGLILSATPDPLMGVNVVVETTGFRWAPERASGDHVDGEGHAHLYVDGEKVGRVYGEWLHLQLEPGAHEIRVTLNGNDHRDYLVDGEPVEATVTVEVPEAAMH
jgi:hypothetical protein